MSVIIDEFRMGYTWVDVVPQAAPPVILPSLEIKPAVMLEWQKEVGKTYQIQYSYDMNNWFDLGQPIQGSDEIQRAYDEISGNDKKFFRVEAE